MNRHLKVAFMVAPILAVIGFIGADYYDENEASQEKFINLTVDNHCDVINSDCVLISGEFKINVSDKAGITEVNSTWVLDSVTLFLVDKNNKMTEYPLGMQESAHYWQRETNLRKLAAANNGQYKLRLIAKIKGGRYIAEFDTKTVK